MKLIILASLLAKHPTEALYEQLFVRHRCGSELGSAPAHLPVASQDPMHGHPHKISLDFFWASLRRYEGWEVSL